MSEVELYNCPHCGVPTKGKVIGMVGKKVVREMCQACKDYIGSPAAQLPGATMKNRKEMANEDTGDEGKIWDNNRLVSCVVVTNTGNPEIIITDFRAG